MLLSITKSKLRDAESSQRETRGPLATSITRILPEGQGVVAFAVNAKVAYVSLGILNNT